MTTDTWTCDTCGQPIRVGGLDAEARYTIADRPEERVGRHWRCNPTTEQLFDEIRRTIARAEAALGEIRRRTR